RAVLFTGSAAMRARLPTTLPDCILAVEYAPHAAVFPHAAVAVHHGGVGTSAEALHAGAPSLVVPHGFDQYDNAARLHRLGVAEALPAGRYRADRATRLLETLSAPSVRARSTAVAVGLRAEDGAVRAADLIEAVLTA
ncbi:MAG: glycosyltransferase, partial [Xanthomonadaceae bacterium]|nr:glycosyltransferase [Xanthomonadaceae bacterium]